MKKLFPFIVICSLLFSSCQFIFTKLQNPTFSETQVNENPTVENLITPNYSATPSNPITITAIPKPESTTTRSSGFQPSATPTLPLILQKGSPAYILNFVHINEGCAWFGIAGQIFNNNNQTVNNLIVNLKGKLGSATIDKVAVTGIPEANFYGPGGYEIKIGDKPIASEDTLSIQVFDLKGNNLSKTVSFKTFSDCNKNLIIINFQME
jgi:hypothetical protein